MELESKDAAGYLFWKRAISSLDDIGHLPHETGGLYRPTAATSVLTFALDGFSTKFDFPIRSETMLRAAWAIVQGRHASNDNILFWCNLGGNDSGLVPLRVTIPQDGSVSDWLQDFETWLKAAEEAGSFPPDLAERINDFETESVPKVLFVTGEHPTFDRNRQPTFSIIAQSDKSGMALRIEYDSGSFSKRQIEALGHHVQVVLRSLATTPSGLVRDLPVLIPEEKNLLLNDWNATTIPFPEQKCIHDFFADQVAKTPDAIALVFRGAEWTYRELDAKVELFTRQLRSHGIRPGSLVAVCLNRSLNLVATLFAVFRAGGAYVPLDPWYPTERLRFMVGDAKPTVVVVSKATEHQFADIGVRLLQIDSQEEIKQPPAPPVAPKSSDPAYVLYTSGSTGQPKGVVVTHRNVSNFFIAMDAVIGTEPGTWLAVTSVGFDISVFELFWTLARGFTVILQEEGQLVSPDGSAYSLPQQIKRYDVTHLQCTPSLASILARDRESLDALRQIRRLMVGGEPLPLDVARELAGVITGEMFNLYGPTETTVWSSAQKIEPDEKRILIGRPVANNRMYVLDAERRLAPIGSIGELYIAGDGVAREYLNRPELTRERFVTHSFGNSKPERMYRTGDLVRYTAQGQLEFVGRIDQQIKIRGVRVELGEIEVNLREHADIRDAVVIVRETSPGEQQLVAYVISTSPAPPAPATLRTWLGVRLPGAMVPSAIVYLAEFPKTPNGKLNRRALPDPESEQKTIGEKETPATDLERQIAEIWADTLGLDAVSVLARFFDLGGHSLLMVEVHDQLSAKLGREVALIDLFRYPTIRSLADFLGQSTGAEGSAATGANRGQLRQQSIARRRSLHRSVSGESP
ncbi:amino acid adenylation domain-containing protein [Methylacidiphilales bacterium]|nr:amino acid adenylation domain-containing protein [Candidatus Methylacidiphilales bacterium]